MYTYEKLRDMVEDYSEQYKGQIYRSLYRRPEFNIIILKEKDRLVCKYDRLFPGTEIIVTAAKFEIRECGEKPLQTKAGENLDIISFITGVPIYKHVAKYRAPSCSETSYHVDDVEIYDGMQIGLNGKVMNPQRIPDEKVNKEKKKALYKLMNKWRKSALLAANISLDLVYPDIPRCIVRRIPPNEFYKYMQEGKVSPDIIRLVIYNGDFYYPGSIAYKKQHIRRDIDKYYRKNRYDLLKIAGALET